MIMSKDVFDKLPAPKDDELDMLDLAAEVENTSRLGCQVRVAEFMNNAEIRLPSLVVNQLD
jgi:ferredoxin